MSFGEVKFYLQWVNEWMNEWMNECCGSVLINYNNNNDIIINSLLKSHKNLIKTTHKMSVKYSWK